MVQNLIVCRLGTGWAFRDVTGETYGHSTDIEAVIDGAQRLAQRLDAHVSLTLEAVEHLKSVTDARAIEAATLGNMIPRGRFFGNLWTRLIRGLGRR